MGWYDRLVDWAWASPSRYFSLIVATLAVVLVGFYLFGLISGPHVVTQTAPDGCVDATGTRPSSSHPIIRFDLNGDARWRCIDKGRVPGSTIARYDTNATRVESVYVPCIRVHENQIDLIAARCPDAPLGAIYSPPLGSVVEVNTLGNITGWAAP